MVAADEPTLPYPCTATVVSDRGLFCRFESSRVTMATPLPVASLRPCEPPRAMGLPVTISIVEVFCSMQAVSAIQAMIWASVLTSGAGISRLGPRMGKIMVV
jgi:hypothetical protein